jgi:AcrR family transcriptional regulator
VKLLDSNVKASPDETRSRILAAAREIFALKGTRGTTTREVADRAGVNEATVFRHFGTKQALLHAMLDVYCESRDMIRNTVQSLSGPLEEQLRALAQIAIDGIKRKEDLIRVGLAEQVNDPDVSAMTWRSPVGALEVLSDYMQTRIHAGELHGDAEMLARIFMSFWFTYVLGRKIWNTPDDVPDRERAINQCVEVFLNGARSR